MNMKLLAATFSAAAFVAIPVAQASAATVFADMGVLNADSSVSGSVTVKYNSSNDGLSYNFGATGAPEAAFTSAGTSTTGDLDIAFEFEIVGASLTLVNADAVNPKTSQKLQNAGTDAPQIYITDGLGGPTVLGPDFFAIDGTGNFSAGTGAITLPPGDYYEYIVGRAFNSGARATLINVGAFAADAVPEPGAWALMILGLGGIGCVLRRRRSSLAVAALTLS